MPALNRPEFRPLPAPKPGILDPKHRKQFRYKKLLDEIRNYPGRPAVIAVFNGPTPKATALRYRNESNEIRHWLRRNHPDEYWSFHSRRVPDTWAKRELWTVFHTGDPAETAELRRQAKVRMHLKGDAAAKRAMAAVRRVLAEGG